MPGESARSALESKRSGDTPDALARCFVQGATPHNLNQLLAMRNVAIVGQTVTLLVVDQGLGIGLPLLPMFAVVLALALFNAATWRALRSGRTLSERDLLLQLLVDVAALTLQLAMSGGAGNPFVGMLLMPLVVTAACLPWRTTWLVAAVVVGCHTLLAFWYRPLFAPGEEARHVQWLVAGTWVNHTLIAGMVAFFVVRIATGLRESERARAAITEREIRNEHVVRVGTLAAGAAHELAQPLATMSLLLSDLEGTTAEQPQSHDLARQAMQQLGHCRETLGLLLNYGRNSFPMQTAVQPVDQFLRACLDTFRTRRPAARATLRIDSPGTAPAIRHDLALRQAVLNLLANAADVSPDWIELRVHWDDEEVTLAVHDRGPGITPEVTRQIGKMFFTTKPAGAGNGLGLNLAHTAVARLGGTLDLDNAPEGGARARIVLPVESPAAAPAPVSQPRVQRA